MYNYVAANFFISVNFCFSFVLNAFLHTLPHPKTMEKKLTEIKNSLQHT